MSNVGIMVMLIGLSMGDSGNLLIPAVVIALGAVLYFAGQKKEPGRDRSDS